MTKKELKNLSGRKFQRLVKGGWCKDNIDQMRQDIKDRLKEQGRDLSLLIEDDRQFTYNNSFILKPLMKKSVEGVITFRSNDYIFEHEGKKSYGPKMSELEILGDGVFKIKETNIVYKLIA